MTVSNGDAISFLRGLRQIRSLRPDPIPPRVMNDILDVARWTGSARNLQPWDFVVIEDRQTLQRFAAIKDSHAAHQPRKPLAAILHRERW